MNKIRDIREKISCSRFSCDEDFSNFIPATNLLSSFEPVSMEELKLILGEMTIKTSYEDPLPAPLLKSSIDLLLPYILELVNLSLETGSISGLKKSVINPILKKFDLDAEKFSNYLL